MTVGMQGKIRISFYVRHKFTKLLFVPLNKNCSTVISVMIWGLLTSLKRSLLMAVLICL